MEIITYVLDGALEHKDSTGNRGVIRPGVVQRMSAGRGIRHSEYNASRTEPVHLMQIWIEPSEQEITPRFTVVNDSELILAGGTPDGWGVALVAGTGSVCLGRTREGRTVRVGGWGPILGDEGSGYQIAVSALRRVTQTADGRAEAKALLAAVLRHWSLPEAGALIRYVHRAEATPSEIAGLATVVLDLATRGDDDARAIVEGAADELAGHVRTVVRKLGVKQPPLALSGGLLRAGLRQALLTRIGDDVGTVNYVNDPPVGGVVLARRLLQGPSRPA